MSYDEVHRSVIEAAKARVAEAKETRNYDDGGWAALMQMVAERMVEEEKRKAEAERMAELEAEFKAVEEKRKALEEKLDPELKAALALKAEEAERKAELEADTPSTGFHVEY